MKKMTIVLLVILLPILIFAQETTSVAPVPPPPVEESEVSPTPPAEESEAPKSFFNDLIKTLAADTTGTETVPEQSPDVLPAPDPIETVPPEEMPADIQENIIEDGSSDIPAPDEPTPAPVMDTDNNTPVAPVPVPVPDNTVPAPDDNTPPPADTPQIAPENVPTQDIVIGPRDTDEKKTKVKKEREPREYVPYIEPPEAKSKAQKKYLKEMEKLPRSRMRLITFDQADIIFGRKFRSPELAVQNPANLGARAEYTNSFSIIPINTLDLDLKTSTRPFVFIDEYLSTGELLTPEREDSMIAMLGPNGLELPLDISMPTVLNLKMSVLGGSIFANAGLFIQERSRIPGEFFGIVLDGATFDNPYLMDEDLGINLNAYAKGQAGYGTFYELPGPFGELRFGATVNAYAGAFANVNITHLEMAPSMEGVTVEGTLQATAPMDTLNIFGPEGFAFSFVDDYMGIPNITMGFDFGLAWRFKLNRLLPFAPNFLKNYFDFQVGVEDIGAKISMNHAYVREINFSMETDDLLGTFSNGVSLDSMMVLDETITAEDSTISMPLGAKLNMSLHYQPIPQLMLKGGITSFLSDGLNANDGPNYFYGVEIYPVSSLCLHGTVTQKGNYRFSEAGFKLYSKNTEFGLKVRIYDLDFSFTENVSGAGLQLNWARYF